MEQWCKFMIVNMVFMIVYGWCWEFLDGLWINLFWSNHGEFLWLTNGELMVK